jgi:hypothetical protein
MQRLLVFLFLLSSSLVLIADAATIQCTAASCAGCGGKCCVTACTANGGYTRAGVCTARASPTTNIDCGPGYTWINFPTAADTYFFRQKTTGSTASWRDQGFCLGLSSFTLALFSFS